MKRFVKSLFCLLFVAALSISLASCVFVYEPIEPDTPTDPDTPVVPDEPKPSIKDDYDCITIAEAIELAIAAGETGTQEKYYVYGTIKEVSNSVYGEMTITDGTDDLYIYGVYSSDGNTRYDAMTDKPVAGDEIVLQGMLKTFKDSPEMDRGYLQAFNHVKQDIDISDYVEMTIKDAREAEVGKLVKLTGVVSQITYAFGQVPNGFFLVDNTSSIYVYGSEVTGNVKEGNTVTVIGEKTYYVLDSEKANAEKFGYDGCCQIQNVSLIENDKQVSEYDKSWIQETTIKDIIDTPITENITTLIYKVKGLISRAEGTGFTNYYINDIDGKTGTYTYTACNGSDFAWLDQYDGKICTVYVTAINAKSTSTGCFWRFLPIEVIDEGYTFNLDDAAEYALKYHVAEQFLNEYTANPELELITKVDNELIGVSGVEISYSSSNTNVAYFETVDDKVIFNTKESGTATITATATYGDITATKEIELTVSKPITYDSITVLEAINTADDTEVIVKGIVMSSLVNQNGFYLNDGTGVIAVVFANAADLDLISLGNEVIIKGTKDHKVKDSYTGKGQINIYNAELLVNNYGNHEYDTSTFITGKTVNDLYNLSINEDHSTDVYIIEGIVKFNVSAYFTSVSITNEDGSVSLTLYSSSAAQYSFLEAFADQKVTLEIAACNWNSKNYYATCVVSVISEGTKVVNNSNFNK